MITKFLSRQSRRLTRKAPIHVRMRLLRAQILWEKGQPFLLVKSYASCTGLPERVFDDDDTALLDISPMYAGGFKVTREALSFEGYFDETARQIVIPENCILAIYDRLSGDGLLFNDLYEKHKDDDELDDHAS